MITNGIHATGHGFPVSSCNLFAFLFSFLFACVVTSSATQYNGDVVCAISNMNNVCPSWCWCLVAHKILVNSFIPIYLCALRTPHTHTPFKGGTWHKCIMSRSICPYFFCAPDKNHRRQQIRLIGWRVSSNSEENERMIAKMHELKQTNDKQLKHSTNISFACCLSFRLTNFFANEKSNNIWLCSSYQYMYVCVCAHCAATTFVFLYFRLLPHLLRANAKHSINREWKSIMNRRRDTFTVHRSKYVNTKHEEKERTSFSQLTNWEKSIVCV